MIREIVTVFRLRLARLVFCSLLMMCVGCAHAISKEFREQTDKTITFVKLFESPNDFTDKKVVFGGVITRTTNGPDKTEVEVVQKELDCFGYPESTDISGGRFLVSVKGYLEPETFAPGRKVTVAGTVVGAKSGKVGEFEYQYPLIAAKEMKLFKPGQYEYAARGYYGGPYYPKPYSWPYFRPF